MNEYLHRMKIHGSLIKLNVCLKDEMVTLQERLTFKDLQISKLGEAVEREREQVVAQEKEVQSQLACEIERNTKLSSEMREVFRSREVN